MSIPANRHIIKLCLIFIMAISFLKADVIFAQSKLDSLVQKFEVLDESSEQFPILCAEIANEMRGNQADSARFYANYGMELAERLDYNVGLVKNGMQLGYLAMEADSISQSFNYFSKCLDNFNDEVSTLDKFKIYSELGYLEEIRMNLTESIAYYYEGLNLAEELNEDHWLGIIKNNLALAYQKQHSYERAIELFHEAKDHFLSAQDFVYYGHAFVNLGSTFNNINKQDSALYYSMKAVEINLEHENDYGVLNAYSTLGSIHLINNELDKALMYFEKSKDLILNADIGQLNSMSYMLARSYFQMARVWTLKGDYMMGLNWYAKCLSLAEEKNFKELMNNCYRLMSRSYESLGNYNKALESFKKYNDLHIEIKRSENESIIRDIESDYQLKTERLQHQRELDNLQAASQRKKLRNAFALGLLIVFSVILILLYILKSAKSKQIELRNENIQLESESLSRQLEFKKKELTTNVLYLLNKNNFIVSLAKKLGQINVDSSSENKKVLGRIISDIENNAQKESWKEFEVRFQEVHGDFYAKLNSTHLDLSPNDQKLCAFLRLNMTSKDISALTYQTTDSIKVARHRLRKKLRLDTHENLIAYLNKL